MSEPITGEETLQFSRGAEVLYLGGIVEVPLLLSEPVFEALENRAAAHELSSGELIRLLICNYLNAVT